MKRRWKFNRDWDWFTTSLILWGVWAIGGLLGSVTLSSIFDHGDVKSWPVILLLALWGFGSVVVPLIAGIVYGIHRLIKNPLFVRVTESNPDLRKVYKQRTGGP